MCFYSIEMSENVEETNSGVKKEGKWEDIAEFGEEVEDAMRESGIDDESVEKFGDWRPRVEEAEKDIQKKTVEKASMSRNRLEKQTEGVREDLKQAGSNFVEAGRKARNRKNPGEEIEEGIIESVRPAVSKLSESARKMEKKIYSKVMLKFNPYFLDTGDFTADFRSKRNGEYEMDLNISDGDSRRELKQRLEKDE